MNSKLHSCFKWWQRVLLSRWTLMILFLLNMDGFLYLYNRAELQESSFLPLHPIAVPVETLAQLPAVVEETPVEFNFAPGLLYLGLPMLISFLMMWSIRPGQGSQPGANFHPLEHSKPGIIEKPLQLENLALQATFFSAAAHELKTPLTVLKTLAPTMCPLPHLPSQTQTEISQTFAQNLERLELLVADMLESARLEAGAVALHPRSLDLASRTQRVLERLTPLLDRKQQQFEFQTPPNLPPVQADGKRVEQILSNLIDNAAKFAPPASVIEVSLSQQAGQVQVVVADAGPGVPLQEREHIFEKFYSVADKSLAGVGLGLFICRELVRLHGGRIWVEDRPGGGSRFCFTLPLTTEETLAEASL